ncbi:hypothetical protein FRC07_003212 [Ceratobasidium sp. 392]|nr:hypothetical protein FRC07_003212 [Ceratobasidium sp. 392]
MAEEQVPPAQPWPPGSEGELCIKRIAELVAEQVIQDVYGGHCPAVPVETERKRKERCGHLQRVITKIMIQGLRVAKVEMIGSEDQPGPEDIDEDNESPWEIDFSKSPTHADNKAIVDKWVEEVLTSDDLANLVAAGKLQEAQCTEQLVRSLLINSFDAARKAIKVNQDTTGDRLKRLKASKEKSKQKQRHRDLCYNRWRASQGKLYRGKEIPKVFFKPQYHSDSEADPEPDLSELERPMTLERYAELRSGATYEMITPGWRRTEMTTLFHWLDQQHKINTNRPTFTRWYCETNRKWNADDIPDNAPRCMISNNAWNNSMNDAKKALALPSPAGW